MRRPEGAPYRLRSSGGILCGLHRARCHRRFGATSPVTALQRPLFGRLPSALPLKRFYAKAIRLSRQGQGAGCFRCRSHPPVKPGARSGLIRAWYWWTFEGAAKRCIPPRRLPCGCKWANVPSCGPLPARQPALPGTCGKRFLYDPPAAPVISVIDKRAAVLAMDGGPSLPCSDCGFSPLGLAFGRAAGDSSGAAADPGRRRPGRSDHRCGRRSRRCPAPRDRTP